MTNNLRSQLKKLLLPTMSAEHEQLIAEAQSHQWSYAQFLESLCELELCARYSKRVARYEQESKLPSGKTLERFAFEEGGAHAPTVKSLAEDLSWVESAENVLLFGPSGVGKTHLACALGYSLIERGQRVLFSSTMAMVQKLQQAKAQLKLNETLHRLNNIPLLILDDLGYVKKDQYETGVLFELIAHRYESRSLVITSNLPFSCWDQVFPDEVTAVAATDRLVHHAHLINMEGGSYRRKQAALAAQNQGGES